MAKLTIRNVTPGPYQDRIYFNPADYTADQAALIEFHNATCRGCKFADIDQARQGEPFCTFAFRRVIENGICDVKREK
jgi:hypothetical protein